MADIGVFVAKQVKGLDFIENRTTYTYTFMTHDFTVVKTYLVFLLSLICNQVQPISVSWVYVTVCRGTHTHICLLNV